MITAKIGRMVRKWLIDYMTSGPIIKMIIKGVHAVEMMRKLVGNTYPAVAEMGTIRGDFSVDSAVQANSSKRAVHNIIHASGTIEEAKHEINKTGYKTCPQAKGSQRHTGFELDRSNPASIPLSVTMWPCGREERMDAGGSHAQGITSCG